MLACDDKNSVLSELSPQGSKGVAYTAYGHRADSALAGAALGFNGECRETQTGWYLLGNGYRSYSPGLMRFHSPDSWSPFGDGGLNAYAYVEGNPVLYRDPSGHAIYGLGWLGKIFSRAAKFFSSKGTNVSRADWTPPEMTKLNIPRVRTAQATSTKHVSTSKSAQLVSKEARRVDNANPMSRSPSRKITFENPTSGEPTGMPVSARNGVKIQPKKEPRTHVSHQKTAHRPTTVTGPKMGDGLANPPSGWKRLTISLNKPGSINTGGNGTFMSQQQEAAASLRGNVS
jgi:RHS repeat-associated protein